MVAYLRRGEAYRKQGGPQTPPATGGKRRDWRRMPRSRSWPWATLYDARGEFGAAAEWYGQAEDRLKGQDPALLYRLALVRFKTGAPGQALKPLTEAVAKNEASADARYLLGLVQRDLAYLDARSRRSRPRLRLTPGLLPRARNWRTPIAPRTDQSMNWSSSRNSRPSTRKAPEKSRLAWLRPTTANSTARSARSLASREQPEGRAATAGDRTRAPRARGTESRARPIRPLRERWT